MRIVTETEAHGELMALELSEKDFRPECCGALALAGPEPELLPGVPPTGRRSHALE